jgi:plastocyanin
MIRRLVFIAVLIGPFVEAGSSVVGAGNVIVTVGSQVMAPAMALDPQKVELQVGDTVTWVNLTGQGIKVIPDWDETQPLPPYVRPGGTVLLRFDQAGTYRYSVFTATDRFEDDRMPTTVVGIIQVQPPAP